MLNRYLEANLTSNKQISKTTGRKQQNVLKLDIREIHRTPRQKYSISSI